MTTRNPQTVVAEHDSVDLGRRISDTVNELVERYGPEHPLPDLLIEHRLMEILNSQ